MKAIYTCANRLDNLYAFRDSKYVQSEIGAVYRDIKHDKKTAKKFYLWERHVRLLGFTQKY